MAEERAKNESLAAWESIAPRWERWRARLAAGYSPIREWLVAALDPRAGETILELAAGAGDTGFAVAPRLGESGRLVSSDLSPEMVEVARRRAAELGLENVEHSVLDLERIDLGDESVDGALCQSGYMLTADPALALAETRRVLRPGGRLAFSVWGGAAENPWATTSTRVLTELGHLEPPPAAGPGTFALGDEDLLREAVAGAGFDEPRIERVRTAFRFADAAEYERWAVELGDVPAEVVDEFPDGELERFLEALGGAMSVYGDADGFALPGVAFVVLAATRPGRTGQ